MLETIVKIVLLLALLSLTSIRLYELFGETTSTKWELKHEGKVYIPSITICPVNPIGKKYTKVESMSQEASSLFKIRNSRFQTYVQHGVEQVFEDLKLKQTFHIQALSPQNMYPCFTLDPPMSYLEAPMGGAYFLDIDKGLFEEFFVQLHEKDQSSVHQLKQGNSIVWFGQKGTYLTVQMRAVNRIRTRRHNCNETGNSTPHQCVNEFYMEKLGCSFPWISYEKFPKCDNFSDMERLYNLSVKIANRNSDLWEELKSKDCMRESCQQIRWLTVDIVKDYQHGEYFELAVMAEEFEEVTESRLYGLTQFISDFGGYLGLLLGYSSLSLLTWIISKFRMKLNI